MDNLRFDSTDDEVRYLRAVHRVTRMADDVVEDCLERQLGLEAALDLFLGSCALMLKAEAGYVELRGTDQPVLARAYGRPGISLEKMREWQGAVVLENGNTIVISRLMLGKAHLGLLALELRGIYEGGAKLPVALVETMAEQLDVAVLAFMALADGRNAAQKLDELSHKTAFRPRGRIGRYELVTPLGTGGMAQVMIARAAGPEGVGRLVALKRILPHMSGDPSMVDQFLDEAKIGLQLQHPNLVTFYDFGEAGGAYFIAMELVRGVDMSAILKVQSPLPPHLVAGIMVQALEGLHSAHDLRGEDELPLGLVHRDLSPHNVMVGFDGRVKVLDFGVAKSRLRRHVTIPGMVKGKPVYMSPEQAVGDRLDRRSDLFAAGLILYEAVTGERAFERADDGSSMDAIVNEELPRHPKIPLPLWDVIERALRKDPSDRYRNGREMAAALRDVVTTATEAELSKFVSGLFAERRAQFAQWEKAGLAPAIEDVSTKVKKRPTRA